MRGRKYNVRSGATKNFDQGSLIHAIWLKLAELGCGVYVERVPTESNIADLPSREAYKLLERIGAVRLAEPKLDDRFMNTQSWQALSVLGLLS